MQKQIQININPEQYVDKSQLGKIISKQCGLGLDNFYYRILKESLDCRRSPVYRLTAEVASRPFESPIADIDFPDVHKADPIVIVGAGPCGLMAALRLIQKGFRPIIIERGKEVSERKKDVSAVLKDSSLNCESNFCYGEGGAGTFSDGKLYTRSSKRGDVGLVLRFFVYFGAKDSILWEAHPHIGTDCLSRILKSIREKIIDCGGEYHFNTKVNDFIVNNDEVKGVITESGEEIFASHTILATGHSASEIYELFYDRNWAIESKPFAMGVRIEHPQYLINKSQYRTTDMKYLPNAEYSLAKQINGRGVFSFCMCPGGIVVPTPQKERIMVVNGMSNSARSGKFANSALVVTVNEQDAQKYQNFKALSLLKFQQECEKNMYYKGMVSPAQKITDFVRGKESSVLAHSSFRPSLVACNMAERLPQFISDNLQTAIIEFDKKIHGFLSSEGNVIGLESRTSSAVRILRNNDTYEHVQLRRLYPCGEGAGYAGGITSSALDGINVADAIGRQYGR